ncbi:MAG: transcriptional regulator, TetR family [Verrucomicrobiaceae bacterium]|nr:transcriptional regulator, TetR family [Verrucomicrobiaceae bacterium]
MDIDTKPNPASRLSPERYAHLLAIAAEVFLARGLGNTTIEQIAQLAGISKATIYRRFRNKEELFEEVILTVTTEMAQALDAIELKVAAPELTLRAAAQAINASLRLPRHVEVMRALIAEASRQPELVKHARLRMVATLTGKLNEYFQQLIDAGIMVSTYSQQTAVSFVFLASGGLRPLLNATADQVDDERRLEADLQMFLRGCGLRAEL